MQSVFVFLRLHESRRQSVVTAVTAPGYCLSRACLAPYRLQLYFSQMQHVYVSLFFSRAVNA